MGDFGPLSQRQAADILDALTEYRMSREAKAT
jgi:hypothetical protein